MDVLGGALIPSNHNKCLGNAEGQGLRGGKMNSSATISPLQYFQSHLGNLLVIPELVKAACKVELEMPLAVVVFKRPCTSEVGNVCWKLFVTRQNCLEVCFPS